MKNLCLLILFMVSAASLAASVETIQVQKKFNRIKREQALLVVFAYDLPLEERIKGAFSEEGGGRTQRWQAIHNVYLIFEAFAGRPTFADAVTFALVNFARGDMKSLRDEWGVEQDALLFMKDGKVLVTQIIDAASFTPQDMQRFLARSNVADFAEYEDEERALKKQRARERRRLESRPVVSFGVGLGYGCAYPWASGCVSPWSWGYGGWGCYGGWGRRCCW